MSPLVSVVMPVYNCERYVAEAVASALAQDHPAKEILVIDDGSHDRSLEVLRQFGDAIRVISVPNGGPARARNLGMREARGDYIAFLDADDVWLPGKLSAQVAQLERHRDVGACYTRWFVWSADAEGRFSPPDLGEGPIAELGLDAERSGWVYCRLLFDCELLTTTVMLRTMTAREVGYFEPELPVGEDYDYWLRLSRVAPISKLAGTGALYRVVPASASRTARVRNYEYEVIHGAVQRWGLSSPDGITVSQRAIERRLDHLLFQHGYLHLHQGDPRIALRCFAEILRHRPWQPQLWLHASRAVWRQFGRAPAGAAVTR